MPSRIVTYVHRPKRPRPKAQPAAITGRAIVTAKKASRRRPAEDEEIDPEAEARVKAFFARVMRPP